MANRVDIYNQEDIKLIRSKPMFTNFGRIGEQDYVELHVLSGDNVLESNYNIDSFSVDKKDTLNSSPTIKLNIHDDIRDLGYRSGRFDVQYNFFRKIVGDNNNSLIIDEISKSRREIRVRPKDPENMALNAEFLAFGDKLGDDSRVDVEVDFWSDVVLNFGENVTATAVNWMIDYKVWPEWPHSMVIKLYEPLPEDLEEKDELWIVKPIVSSVLEPILVEYDAPRPQPNILAPADFTIPVKYDTASPTGFETNNTLLGVQEETKNRLNNKIFSGSIGDVDINFDFEIEGYDFSNVVHFGSAVKRLENFKHKLSLIEHYDSEIRSLQATGSATASFHFGQNVSKFKNLKFAVIAGFDDIEHHLYYESGSYKGSGSYGDKWDLTWPKESGVEPYKLAPTTSSLAKEWYGNYQFPGADHYQTGAIYSASLYDSFNDNSLVKLVPGHIQRDENNDEYLTFVDMVAQHFDYIYFYIKELTSIHKRNNELYEGLSKDLLQPVLESLGWYPHQGFDFDDLWTFHMGTDTSGSFGGNFVNYTADFSQSVTYANNSQASQSFSKEEITKELWKRILNNLPGIMKTKGSERSVRSLISTYGIPSTILKIYEYGGPQVVPNKHSKLKYDRYSYALRTTNDTTITGSWAPASASVGPVRYPDTVEFRFRIPDTRTNKTDMVLWNTWSGSAVIWAECTTSQPTDGLPNTVNALKSGDVYGKVHFALRSGSGASSTYISSSTDWAPLYDGDWWNIMLTRFDAGKRARKEVFFFTGSDNINDHHGQDLRYDIYCKKQADHSEFGKITWGISSSIDISGSVSAHSRSYNAAWGGGEESIVSEFDGETLKHYLGGAVGSFAGDDFLQNSGSSRTLSGSLQEFRMWHHHLSESVFDSRVMAPRTIQGRTVTASFDDLLVYWPLGNDLNKYEPSHSVEISSSHPDYFNSRFKYDQNKALTTKGYYYGYNFTSQTGYSEEEERNFTLTPREIGPSPYSDKIRLEDNSLLGVLSIDNKMERSSADTNPVDSNKLGVFFSPTDEINLDVAHELGPYEPDDFVGDPVDEFRPSYTQLKHVRDYYFKKHFGNPNFYDYIRLLAYFDDSLFRTIRQLLPARANAQVGLMVKPHLLERPKIQSRPSASKGGLKVDVFEELQHTVVHGTLGLFDSMSITSNTTEVGRWRQLYNSSKIGQTHVGSRENTFMLVPSTSNAAIMKDDFKPRNSEEAARGLLNTTVGELEVDMDYKKYGYDHWLQGARYIHTTVEFPRSTQGTDPDGAKVWNAYYDRDAWGMTIHTPPHQYIHGTNDLDQFTASRAIDVTDAWQKWGLNRKRNTEIYVPFISQSRKSFERKIKLNYYASSFSQSKGIPIPESHILSNLVVTYGRPSMQGIQLPSHSLSESAEYQDFKQTPLQNLYWHGCKLIGSDFNMESSTTVDGGPVVEFHEVSPYKYVAADDTSDGKILTAGEGRGENLAVRPAARPIGNRFVRPSPTRGGFKSPVRTVPGRVMAPPRGGAERAPIRGGKFNPGPRATRGRTMMRGGRGGAAPNNPTNYA